MQIKRTCKQCGTPLSLDKKLGAKYCNHSCQQGYYKRREIIRKKIKKIEEELQFNQSWIDEEVVKSKQFEKNKIDLSEIKRKTEKIRGVLSTLQTLLTSTPQVFRNSLVQYLDRNMHAFEDDYGHLKFGTSDEQSRILNYHRKRFEKMQDKGKLQLKLLEESIEKKKASNAKLSSQELMHSFKIAGLRVENITLEKQLVELREIDLENLPIKPNPKKQDQNNSKEQPIAKGISGNQILKMKFNNLELKGVLGTFLGLIQRNKCAIALTGDSGAGKTTFSFQLARAFRDVNQSVGYFSLESGITETTQSTIEKLRLTSSKFEVFGDGNLKDVRLQAAHFDCIIIDSYAKISSKANDFESLREDFPNTFFIIIFQKTTDGKIRGGSSILYNSTATIDIRLTKGNHRIAFMQKSRYGTENFVYSISLNQILKNDKTPIKWSEIQENWLSPNDH